MQQKKKKNYNIKIRILVWLLMAIRQEHQLIFCKKWIFIDV